MEQERGAFKVNRVPMAARWAVWLTVSTADLSSFSSVPLI